MPDYTREQPKEVSLPPRLPLVGIINERPGELDRDSKLVNGYIEAGEEGELSVIKRPGLELVYRFGENWAGAGMFENYFFWHTDTGSGSDYRFYEVETARATFGASALGFSADRLVYAAYTLATNLSYGFAFHTQYGMWVYYESGAILKSIPLNGAALGPYTFATTSGSNIITTTTDEPLPPYSTVTGTGIPVGTTIVSVTELAGTPPTLKQVQLTQNATATNASVSLSLTAAGPDGRASAATGGATDRLVPGIVDLNAALFVANPLSQITNSDRGNPLAWNPLSSIRAYLSERTPLYIIRQLGYILLFKSDIVEVFRDAGVSPGSPLGRQEGMTLEVGLWSSNTVASIDGMIFWCSSTETGKKSAWMFQGGRAKEIAPAPISRVLSRLSPDNGHAFSVSGHTFYVLTDPSEPLSLVYDATSNFWSYWTALDEEYWPFVAATRRAGQTLLQHRSNGCIYSLDPEVFADDHSEFTMDIYPPEFDANVRVHKFLSRMFIVGDQQDGSAVEVRFNDNNREEDKWSDWYEARLDVERPRIDDLGSFVKRAFHIRHTRPTACRLRAIELDLMMGMS